MKIRLHAFEPVSVVNGPGKRAVIWVQGCTLGCPSCFNPETHNNESGIDWEIDKLVSAISAQEKIIDGITISGGEPLQQHHALTELLKRIRMASELSVLLFTGYTWEEIQVMPVREALFEHVDVLLAGRYDANRRVAAGLLGSANKTVHFFTDRYTQFDLDIVPEAEITISPEGEIVLSGIRPLNW